jgi:hypothetical protein
MCMLYSFVLYLSISHDKGFGIGSLW